jgi:autotransporter-associated beta strand protein
MSSSGAIVYWDLTDGVAGAGGPSPSGTWNTTAASWNTVADGTGTPLKAWTAGDAAVFSAGSDATGAYTVNLTAPQTASAVTVEEGTVSLTGSTVNVAANTVTINSGARLSIPAANQITATAGANLNLNGGTIRNTVDTNGGPAFATNLNINVGAAGGTVETANAGGNNFTVFTGQIKGPGNTLTKTGSGEFRFQGSGTGSTTFSKLVVDQGLYRLGNLAGTSELGFGAAPATFTADAITLSAGGSIGNLNGAGGMTLNANRGITLGAGGGGFDTSGGNLTIPGAISGTGDLLKNTSGNLILRGNNTYTGNTLVTSGILTVGSANALGATSGNTQVSDGTEIRVDGSGNTFTVAEPLQIVGVGGGGGGAIAVQNSATPTFSGPVTLAGNATVTVGLNSTVNFTNPAAFTASGLENLTVQGVGNGTITGAVTLVSGGLTKSQIGTWTLAGANSYHGVTYIEDGTLVVSGSITGTSQVTVSGILAGSGTITLDTSGSVPLQTGGKISPGLGLGNAGNLKINVSVGGILDVIAGVADPTFKGALVFDLAAPDASDKITLRGGALNIGTGVLEFDDFAFNGLGGYIPGDYVLFDGDTTIVGTLGAIKDGLAGQYLANLQLGDAGKDIVLHVIPEPTAATLMIGSLGLLINRRRRSTLGSLLE